MSGSKQIGSTQPTFEEQEKKLKAKYGGALGGNVTKRLAINRKYFDSGDYALSKAGKNTNDLNTGVGEKHPSPESIPHQQLTAGIVPAGSPPALSPTSSSSSPSVAGINSGGLPVVVPPGVGHSVGAAGTMANPSGLSPPATHHVMEEVHSPTLSHTTDGRLPAHHQPATLEEGSGTVPPPPNAKPGFVRRFSQTPAGMQYRVKN
ncbi:hypothetical protein GGI20_003484 [Coemansia sp. BCRC 34301]|nr:hypothetical protein GGI20_003484 [Coemansia sp. BCRC 34301]